mmetsp:Transcript_9989/g.11623  ORF Transcript_9989/g.11623 Transcript_9989/m.11623 type:complete len:238 (+) Transcript_9989:377-1090(+)
MLATSSSLRSRTYVAGFPPHSCPLGMNRPGGSTVPSSNTLLLSTTEPSISMQLLPTTLWRLTVQERRTQLLPMVEKIPTYVPASIPVGEVRAACTTVLSPMVEYASMLTLFKSPRKTQEYPTETRSKTSTSPTITALGATYASLATVGTASPKGIVVRCRQYTSALSAFSVHVEKALGKILCKVAATPPAGRRATAALPRLRKLRMFPIMVPVCYACKRDLMKKIRPLNILRSDRQC